MARFPQRLLPALMGLMIAAVAGCDATTGESITLGPSSVRSSAPFVSRGVSVSSPSVRAERIATSVCPAHPPLIAPIDLLFQAGPADMFFTGVQLQFVNGIAAREPGRTFTHADLIDRFGSTLVPAFDSRKFALEFPFGCIGASTGTLSIVVFAADSFHRETRTTLQLVIQ